jgi:pyruvate formate lyase activating enzyme
MKMVSKNELTGRVYDIQGYSVHDGPGIRTTVFLKGCPLTCLWCHSPESQRFDKQLCFMDMRCVGTDKCGVCLSVCPNGAIKAGKREYSEVLKEEMGHIDVDLSLCDDCGKCAETCYPEALFISGKDYTVEELIERLKKEFAFFESSGGGVTISGGEPLSQSRFVLEVLKRLKELGIHTALDTTGFAKPETVMEVLPYVDIFLFDIKHMDSKKHEEIVGVPNEQIHQNARLIAENGGKFQIRVPVVPGYNDSPENLEAVAAFVKELGNAVEVVQVLPYHSFGKMKYERIQLPYPIPDSVESPTPEESEAHLEIFRKKGLPVILH